MPRRRSSTRTRSRPGIEHVNRLIGITQRGQAFELAVNVLNGSELAGVCFSPSGRTLFFNVFGAGARSTRTRWRA